MTLNHPRRPSMTPTPDPLRQADGNRERRLSMTLAERLLVIIESLSQADVSDPSEAGYVIDIACEDLREIAAEVIAGERGAADAKAAGPLVPPRGDPA